MSDLPIKPRRICLRSFYGFSPQDDGYIGWTEESARDRMLGLVEDGDLFMIYGASSAETEKAQRLRVLGFLQVQARRIQDREKASAAGMKRKKAKGWLNNWTYAIPVVRAWRVDESILLERIAQDTYRPEAGQAIAVWSPPLLPNEIDLALQIKVTEVNVFGEPDLAGSAPILTTLRQAFQPSCAFPVSFGERVASYEDGPTCLYLACFDGDGFVLLGRTKPQFNKSVLLKIGISNDTKRRADELNVGFPPASVGKWKMAFVSQPYQGHQSAEAAEQAFKTKAAEQLESLGGEFFHGDLMKAQSIFANIPGVARFGVYK